MSNLHGEKRKASHKAVIKHCGKSIQMSKNIPEERLRLRWKRIVYSMFKNMLQRKVIKLFKELKHCGHMNGFPAAFHKKELVFLLCHIISPLGSWKQERAQTCPTTGHIEQ